MDGEARLSEQEVARAEASWLSLHAQTDADWVPGAITDALLRATSEGWSDVRLALMHVQIFISETREPDRVMPLIEQIEIEADMLGLRAFQANAILARIHQDTRQGRQPSFEQYAEAATLLADESQPARDRVSGLINLAAALKTIDLLDLADRVLEDADRVIESVPESREASAVVALNRALVTIQRAFTFFASGDLDGARHVMERIDALVAAMPARDVPEGFVGLVRAQRRVAEVLLADDDLDTDEANTLLAMLDPIDDGVALMVELATARQSSSPAPDFDRCNRAQHRTIAQLLYARSLERSGADPAVVVAAYKAYAASVTSTSADLTADIEAGIAAMIETRSLTAERRELVELAMTDPLTGVGNRRAFQRALDEHDGAPMIIAIVDLDDFKYVNDTFGHQVGDDVLRRTAELLGVSAREYGPSEISRIGGDEFVVFLPGADPDRALVALESFRSRMAADPWTVFGGRHRPSATVGFACGACSGDLVDVADAELYRLKVAASG